MKIPTLRSCLLTALMLMASFCTFASDFESDGIHYNILSEENLSVEVAKRPYASYTGIIEIPASVIYDSKTYYVTSIGDYAFDSCGLTSVTIPNSVITIGDNAFSGCCGLTSVTIPNSVTTIGEWAFAGCSGLTSVTIPNSVTTIGKWAFNGCSGLIDILVDENNQNYSSIDSVLYDKDASVLHTCPGKKESVTIPNSVTSVGDEAFSGCDGLTSVTIPNSVTTIGDDAFYACNSLTSIFCQATTPPTAGSMTSSEIVLNNCTLYVPTGCKADYEGVDPWRNFFNIEEMDFDGIDTATTEANATMRIAVENGAITVSGLSEQEHIMVYDAQGRLVYSGTERTITNLPRGIYIVKAGSSTAKAAI